MHIRVLECIASKADPLEPLLSSGTIDKDTYTQVWLTTYFFESLWELVQRSFRYIRPVLTQLGWGEVPRSAYELFTYAIYEISEERFSVCLKPYQEVSAGKYLKHNKLLNKAVDGNLKLHEQKLLQHLNAQELQFTTVGIILGVCKEKATSREKLLKAKLDDCFAAIDRLAAHEATQTRKSSSFAWKNGEKIRASRYGGTYSNA